MQVKTTIRKQLNVTQPKWQVSPLTINKPLPSFFLLPPPTGISGREASVKKAIISGAGHSAGCQPQDKKAHVLFLSAIMPSYQVSI